MSQITQELVDYRRALLHERREAMANQRGFTIHESNLSLEALIGNGLILAYYALRERISSRRLESAVRNLDVQQQ